jgi:hypothetical protein
MIVKGVEANAYRVLFVKRLIVFSLDRYNAIGVRLQTLKANVQVLIIVKHSHKGLLLGQAFRPVINKI